MVVDTPRWGALSMTPPPFAELLGMADLAYSVIIEPDDGAFSVIVPALPEARSWGETPEHALEMAREVITLCLDERRARGDDIPPSDAGETQIATVRIPAA